MGKIVTYVGSVLMLVQGVVQSVNGYQSWSDSAASSNHFALGALSFFVSGLLIKTERLETE